MYATRYILLVACFLILGNVQAQKNTYDWQMGISLGMMNYYGDLNREILSDRSFLRKPGGELSPNSVGISAFLEKSLSPAWSLKLDAGYGTLTANDRATDRNGEPIYADWRRALNFRTEIRSLDLLLVYRFNNGVLLSRQATFAPYLFAGAGLIDFAVWGDLFSESGQRYHYWPDFSIRDRAADDPDAGNAGIISQDGEFETRLDGLKTEGKTYDTRTWQIPMGLGLQVRLSDRWSLALQSSLRYTFTDYLDDVSGRYPGAYENALQAYAANPGNIDPTVQPYRGNPDEKNDWYNFTSLNLSYRLGLKLRKFKAPKLYISPGQALRPAPRQTGQDMAVAPSVALPTARKEIDVVRTEEPVETKQAPAPVMTGPLPAQIQELNRKIDSLRQDVREDQSATHTQLDALKQKLGEMNTRKQPGEKGEDSLAGVQQEAAARAELRVIREQLEVMARQRGEPNTTPVAVADSVEALPLVDSLASPVDTAAGNPPYLPAIAFLQMKQEIEALRLAQQRAAEEIKTTQSDEVRLLRAEWNLLMAQLESKRLADSLSRTIRTEAPAPPAATPPEVLGLSRAYVFFRNGSAEIRKSDEALLNTLAAQMKQHANLRLLLRGFADKSGNPALNLAISQRRVAAVKQYLILQGVEETRMNASSLGDSQSESRDDALERKVELELVIFSD